MIMWKEVPGITAVAVILAHGAPCAFRQIRAPFVPGIPIGETVLSPPGGLSESRMFGGGTWLAQSSS
jgi:hypothetical protein